MRLLVILMLAKFSGMGDGERRWGLEGKQGLHADRHYILKSGTPQNGRQNKEGKTTGLGPGLIHPVGGSCIEQKQPS